MALAQSIPQSYEQFIARKQITFPDAGLVDIPELNPMLFDFQRDIVRWALRKGRAALFLDCGMGKSPCQLEWAKHIPGPVLILAPLAVAQQTVREGKKFGIDVIYSRHGAVPGAKITITNYEMLEHFNAGDYAGIVLDESSILKSYAGAFRNQIISAFAKTPYRLACTATPAPNDYMELGNHCEFLGALTRTEMLSTFFVHDGGDTAKWRVKRHAARDFWKWVCSWAVMLRKPSDLGYDDDDFILPPLEVEDITIDVAKPLDGRLFALPAITLQERRSARSVSVEERAEKVAELVALRPDESWIIWCNLNSESDAATRLIPGAVEVRGSHSREEKEGRMLGFSSGDIRALVTKSSIAGFGMNWQHCWNVIFFGLSDSWESYYQAVRRSWRFGQKHAVRCYIVTSSQEGAVTENIKRKEKDAAKMAEEMVNNMHELNQAEVRGLRTTQAAMSAGIVRGEDWEMHLGDCVDVLTGFSSKSIDFSVFSPPYAALYTYGASGRDMGNSRDTAEFFYHFNFAIKQLFRLTKAGRIVAVDCMNLPLMKERDGVIGLDDFRGRIIRKFKTAGFIFHSEHCMWKDPLIEATRTKSIGLMHKQLVKDSAMCRAGLPQYLLAFRKPGTNQERITHQHGLDYFIGENPPTKGNLSHERWRRYASPVWDDIDFGNTLNKAAARDGDDERHICPMSLDIISRALHLWSNPGDLVLSPFAGIGSEGYVAVQHGRRFIGVELKESYFKLAVANLRIAKQQTNPLFAEKAQ